ncbi:sulfatase [Haladaptatus pallidirubidus]|uniref:Sulfatase-like hydrolase/transferase n=1 Tax=Haladaptatus pallidirubidus TaxID=1008152 RepID=A0AAV3UHM9_9EURY|nr:sulfatase [Haladaptatus pallidirubidus]
MNPPKADIKNVLLITVDSLRYDWTLTGDLELPTTNELVKDGTYFNSAFATGPGTSASFPAMLTGTLPLSHSGLGPLNDDRPRVASNLRKAGLNTGGFQSNPFLSRHFNYDVGFDIFEDYQNPLMGIATKVFPRGIELNNPKLRKVDDVFHITDAIKYSYKLIKGKPRPYVSADVITDDTVKWLDTVNEPFFGWSHYMDVHHPCFPPKKYRAQFDVEDVSQTDVSEWYSKLLTNPESLSETEIDLLRRLYDAAVVYTDFQIGRIIRKLHDLGIYENTLIVFTSDHGELFGEYNKFGKPERMYDELLQIPLIITNGPDYLPEYKNELVSLLDLPPLFHNSLGLSVPSEYEGTQFGKDDPRDYITAEHEVNGKVVVGARSKNWLYEVDEIRDDTRLFDLRKPRPKQVSFDENSETNRIQEAVMSRLADLDVETRDLENEVEGDVQNRLEDLGYL